MKLVTAIKRRTASRTAMSMSLLGVLVAVVAMGMIVYQEFFGKFPVLVASSPASAEIYLDGTVVGKTPLTLELKRGTYTLRAKKAGYEPMEHAIYVKAKRRPNLVNIQLLPTPLTTPTAQSGAPSATQTSPDIQKIYKEIEKLRSIIVMDPEEAATIPILSEKVRLRGEALKALRDDLKDIREQGRWYLGATIAIIVGLLGVIATLFIAGKGK